MTTASSSATIHPFFCGGPAPAIVVAGTHHSRCTTCSSNKLTDPDNAETLSSDTMHKHKASGGTAASHHVNGKVVVDDKGSTNSTENRKGSFSLI